MRMRRLHLPIAAAQGMWLRSTTKVAPPASGPTRGRAGPRAGEALRVAVIGESTAAGCGVTSHTDGFAGSLARELAARTRRPVDWQVVGRLGATARRIRHRLLPQLDEDLDAAVLLAGVNDVMGRRSPEEWRDDLTAIVDGLTARAAHVVVAGTPPFALFPAMPATLGRYLTERATALDDVAQHICASRPRVTWVTMPGVPGPDFFATDRFHPSAVGYGHWAKVIAGHVRL